MKTIYVGNLAYATEDGGLESAFSVFGQVNSASVIRDRETGRSRGFGFVEMENDADAERAISEMDGKDLDGRMLNVREARPRPERPPRRDNY